MRQEAARRYQDYQARKSRCEVAGKAWVGSVLGALVALLIFSRGRRRGWLLWLPVVVVLGPLGLLAWRVAGRGREPGPRRAALVEAVGDVVPTAVAFVTMQAAFVLGLAALGWRAQVLVLLSVPLLMGWWLFHGPLLALGTKRSLPRLLLQRLPQAWVVAHLDMAGISARRGAAGDRVSARPPVLLDGRTCRRSRATAFRGRFFASGKTAPAPLPALAAD